MTEQFVVTLDSDAAERLKRLAAETGQSLEDFAREVLEEAAQEFDAAALETLKTLWAESEDGVPPRDGRQVFDRLIAKHRAQAEQAARKS